MTDYAKLGKKYRRSIVDAAVASGRGHFGSAFSVLDILVVLFEKVLKFDASKADWPDRDRLILSKGHGCLALYAILADKGYFPADELLKFCRPDGILGGHPDHRKIPGVEASTGSLGHGLAIGTGMAVAARLDRRDYRVFVVLGDGECNEGSVWEGAMAAAKHRLENLTVLIDSNGMQSYGPTAQVLDMEPLADKWRAFGFAVREADLDHPPALEDLLLGLPLEKGKPGAVICHTVKGKGVSFAENSVEWHHKARLTDEEIRRLREELKD